MEDARPKAAPSELALHTRRRGLQLLIAVAICSSEAGKFAWVRLQSRSSGSGENGYWWVTQSGFSFFHNEGSGGMFIEAILSLVLALVLTDIVVQILWKTCGPKTAFALHASNAALLVVLAVADLALNIGAGGARVSLPLILFAVSESSYVWRVVKPWLHHVLASSTLLVISLLLLRPCWRLCRLLLDTQWRTPWVAKLAAGALSARMLWKWRAASQGVGSDLLSQLGCDVISMLNGSQLSANTRERLAKHRTEAIAEVERTLYPPLLLFHWEAARASLLRGDNASATPFLHRLVERRDVISGAAIASVPVTLKSAWEALCGISPAMTSDFREHGSGLRSECLPRALKRCCGYRSVLAKTDHELPEIPRRVFGFDRILVKPDLDSLLSELQELLRSWGALEGNVPVLVYFYAGDAHPPYHSGRVPLHERGFATDEIPDVYLALTRRTDDAAERLTGFWPPPRKAAWKSWQPEHGLSIYFGDHGEQLHGTDPPPHGNLVTLDVIQTLLVVEARSFAPSRSLQMPRVVRLADVYATVSAVSGLSMRGSLFAGRSLLSGSSTSRHEAVASFSFYRPGELAALHFEGTDSSICIVQYQRKPSGWSVTKESSLSIPGSVPTTDGCRQQALAQLQHALAQREDLNALLTESNLHAAWLYASLKAAALRAKDAAKQMLMKVAPQISLLQN